MQKISHDHFREVAIDREPIELYQLLKLADLSASGGEAKHAIALGLARVNGRVETRKRKKIMAGDLVEFGREKIRVSLGGGKREESPAQES